MVSNKPEFNIASLREQVFNYLKNEIATLGIRPGEALSLRKISEQLGIGITPLRDALIQLEGAGMVRILPRRGIYLREFTLKDIENYYDTLGMIEEHALQTAINRITPEHCSIMVDLNEQIKEYTRAETYGYANYMALNKAFHRVYLNLSDNSYLPLLWENIQQKLYYLPTNNIQTKEWDELCNDEHEYIIKALSARNLKLAVRWTKGEHLNFHKHEEFMRTYYGVSTG